MDAVALLNEWALWQQAQGHSDRTVNERRRRIELFAAGVGVDPSTATTQDVTRYLAGLTCARSSRATFYAQMRAWFTWLVRQEYRVDDPTVRVPAPKSPRRQPRPLTDRQLEAVLHVRTHRRTSMMILLATFQGLRVHEIAKVRGEDVDHLAEQLHVLGKGGVDCFLPLHPIVAAAATTFPPRGYWFPTHARGNRFVAAHVLGSSVSAMVSEAMKRAGVPGGAHRLRHTYATRMLQNGVDVRVVQELLRHASLATTQTYTGVTFEQQRAAILGLAPPVFPHPPSVAA